MKMTFRWYGEDDTVTLEKIRQIPGMKGIVSAIYDIPVGEVWPLDRILKLKETVEKSGLELSVIESVPVHEDIKMGTGGRDRYIENYCETLRNLSKAGIDCVCYNFMPVFDWTRSDLAYTLPDGSNALLYDEETVLKMDPVKGELSLPGWDSSYTQEEVRELISAYGELGEEGLWKNLEKFLKKVIPVAEECGVKMAIHPDDPPYPIFGIPRIITCEENIDRMLKLVDSEANSLCLCTGSLGCAKSNDVVKMIRKYSAMNRIAFMHIRNILIMEDGSFEESGHLSDCGSLDMYEVVKALVDTGFEGYVRPDHGRMIWGETGKPGYGLFDRALGATYINGLFEAVEKGSK